jgi:hypothetical protein
VGRAIAFLLAEGRAVGQMRKTNERYMFAVVMSATTSIFLFQNCNKSNFAKAESSGTAAVTSLVPEETGGVLAPEWWRSSIKRFSPR